MEESECGYEAQAGRRQAAFYQEGPLGHPQGRQEGCQEGS